jgi:hypothetical protein
LVKVEETRIGRVRTESEETEKRPSGLKEWKRNRRKAAPSKSIFNFFNQYTTHAAPVTQYTTHFPSPLLLFLDTLFIYTVNPFNIKIMPKPSILFDPGSFALPEFYENILTPVAARCYEIQGLHFPKCRTQDRFQAWSAGKHV